MCRCNELQKRVVNSVLNSRFLLFRGRNLRYGSYPQVVVEAWTRQKYFLGEPELTD